MSNRKRKSQATDALDTIVAFTETVDTVFERLTGKNIASWLKEFRQQPRELPQGEPAAPQQESTMSLANAYAVLGLPPTASLEEVKRNYKRLAVVFHPDKGGYKEAMVLLNNAYEQIKRENKAK